MLSCSCYFFQLLLLLPDPCICRFCFWLPLLQLLTQATPLSVTPQQHQTALLYRIIEDTAKRFYDTYSLYVLISSNSNNSIIMHTSSLVVAQARGRPHLIIHMPQRKHTKQHDKRDHVAPANNIAQKAQSGCS
jgi:hypothetical protein